nr:TetR/AcrR family transcriptional regulator [Pseudonocardia dioxanivorans]
MRSAAARGDSPARRPRDRGSQIAAIASELFAERGYQSVKMEDIAESAGITPRAIYRHYENKQALLAHVVLGEQMPVIQVVERLSTDSAATPVPERLRALVEVSLDNRRLSVLWQREARHLTGEDFTLVRERTKMLANQYIPLFIAPERSDLDDDTALLRAWTIGSISSSAAYFESTMPRAQLVEELVGAAHRVVVAEPAERSPHPRAGAVRRTPGSRREQLIAAAASAFRRHGYAGVSIDDIGGEIGVVGPALYRYFDNKAEILVAAITRLSEWRALETLRTLEQEPRSEKVIDGLVDGYVGLAAQFPDLVALSLTERLFLPQDARERLQRTQSEHLAEWQRWLVAARPELDAQRAAVLVNVARTVIDDCVRNRRLQANESFEQELRTVVRATLGIAP